MPRSLPSFVIGGTVISLQVFLVANVGASESTRGARLQDYMKGHRAGIACGKRMIQ